MITNFFIEKGEYFEMLIVFTWNIKNNYQENHKNKGNGKLLKGSKNQDRAPAKWAGPISAANFLIYMWVLDSWSQ